MPVLYRSAHAQTAYLHLSILLFTAFQVCIIYSFATRVFTQLEKMLLVSELRVPSMKSFIIKDKIAACTLICKLMVYSKWIVSVNTNVLFNKLIINPL